MYFNLAATHVEDGLRGRKKRNRLVFKFYSGVGGREEEAGLEYRI